MKVYISGKIGAPEISEATRQKFAKAEELLKNKGLKAFNPTDEHWVTHLKTTYEIDKVTFHPFLDEYVPDFYAYCLLRDMMAISTKDAIYMLPDFLDSKGAKAEYAFAIATGKQVYYDEELFRDGTLRGASYKKNRLP